MPRPGLELRFHKASKRGIVRCKALFGPNPKYLRGSYKSPEMYEHLAEIQRLAESVLKPSATPRRRPRATASTVADLFIDFYTTVCPKLNEKDRKAAKRAMDIVAKRHGSLPPNEFDPIALEECREDMVALGWSRRYVNRQVGKVRRAFKWGVTRGHVKAETYGALRLLDGIKRGWTSAPELPPVRGVEWPAVERVLPFVPSVIADMLRVQWLTGMRSEEVAALSAAEIHRSGMTWKYVPTKHKKSWRGEQRAIYFGPQARRILKPYLFKHGPFFTPADAIAERYAKLRAKLKPLPDGKKRKPPKIRKTLSHYTTAAYNKAVRYGFIQLGRSLGLKGRPAKGQHVRDWLAPKKVEYFHPYQLRHARATITRAKFGIEGAQAQLQDTFTAAMIYAEKSDELHRRIASETG